tara:strand:+ start:1248 stop:1511 length:264 start_codon:yes stop_codon:yes gene_type:complete
MSEPYTGSYEPDSLTIWLDESVEPILLERHINYEKDYRNHAVTVKVFDDDRMADDVLDELGMGDLCDHYLYSRYNVDANAKEDLSLV